MRIKRKNEHKRREGSGFLRGAAAVFTAAALMWCCPFVSLADSTGTVKVESATVRQSTDTESDAVGSVARGTSVTIKDEVTDSSGTLWYQVDLNGNTTGYVRADLIEKGSGSSTAADNNSQTDVSPEGGDAAAAGTQAESAMDAQYAAVSVASAKIRSAPSTNDSVVDTLGQDTQLIVSGQSNGSSDGKVWYYVTFTGTDGTQKTGFVRSDLITLGDMVPLPEEQPAEEQSESEQPETVYQDYELVFRDGEWILVDHLGGGYEYKLQQLLDTSNLQNDTLDDDAKNLVRQRIAIVALGVVAAVLLIVVIVMAIKLRDAYYEEYDEDDDGEEEDEDGEEDETPVRRNRRSEPVESSSRRGTRQTDTASRRPGRASDGYNGQTGEIRKTASKQRKAKNFLLDDDDFEFEFLNMDDKDL